MRPNVLQADANYKAAEAQLANGTAGCRPSLYLQKICNCEAIS